MSLETLLEAARFIELQEHAAANHQQSSPPPPQSQPTASPSLPTLVPTQQQQPQQQPVSSSPPQLHQIQAAVTLANTNTPCIIPCVGPATATLTVSGGVAANGSIVGTARSIVLTATPLRIKPVDHTGKQQQIAPSSNHSGNTASTPVHGIINNSFDIINPLVFDDQVPHNVAPLYLNALLGGARRKQPPLVFRSGTREVHNKLEKHRRAHLKECFDVLKQQLPASEEKKTSNLSILHSALRHIKALQKAEQDGELERERLKKERLLQQQRLVNLKTELAAAYGDSIYLTKLLDNIVQPDLIINEPVLNGNNIVVKEEMPQRSTATSTPPATSLATLAISNAATPTLLKQEPRTTVTINGLKEGLGGTAFVPMAYPVAGAPLLLQKVTLVPKTPLSFTAQPANGSGAPQVLPLVTNATAAKYIMKPVVVVSTPSRTS